MFLLMEHGKIKFSSAAFWKMREFPFTYSVCELIVSENRRFNITTYSNYEMHKCKKDLNNNNLKSTYYCKYLIRLLSKTIRFNSVNLQFAPCL